MTGRRARFERKTLGVLLFAGVLAPVTGEAIDSTTHPLPVVIAAAGVAAVFATMIARLSRRASVSRRWPMILALLVSVVCALILRAQSNVFYPSTTLFGGMVVLLALHVAAVALRHMVERDAERAPPEMAPTSTPAATGMTGLERLPPNEIRVVHVSAATLAPGDGPTDGAHWPEIPAIAFGDALASWAAWLLVIFWILVALGRRHVATACLLLLGALLALRCVAMLPEALSTPFAGTGRRRRAS